MQISDGSVVTFHYTLTDADGTVLDSSSGRDALTYLQGQGNIVAGLEKTMAGKSAGDRFEVDVSPEEGYGTRQASMVQIVPRSAFQGIEHLEPGMQFQSQGSHGPMTVVVTAVNGDSVTVDGNHALAGQTLHFDIEITDVRQATPEELQHGHVHGAGGHAH